MGKFPITLKQRSQEISLDHPGKYDTNNPYIFCRDHLIAFAKRIVFNNQQVIITSSDSEKWTINSGKEFIEWIVECYEENKDYGFSKDVKEELSSHFK